MIPALYDVQIQSVVIRLHRDLHVREEEILFVFPERPQQLHVFDTAVHHGTAVRCKYTVRKIISAFHCTFQQSAGILTQETCKVIGGHFHRAGPRGTKPCRKHARQIQERLRGVLTGISRADLPFLLGLPDEGVVSLHKNILKIRKMLQIFQCSSLILSRSPSVNTRTKGLFISIKKV